MILNNPPDSQLDKEYFCTKQRILSAAIALFSEYGYQGTSITRVMNQTGLAKTVLFYHFKSKKSLAISAVKENISYCENSIFNIVFNTSLLPDERLQKFIDCFYHYFTQSKFRYLIPSLAIHSCGNFHLFEQLVKKHYSGSRNLDH